MIPELTGRDVDCEGQRVTIYDLSQLPKSFFSAVYQNNTTRALDLTFKLTGTPLARESPEYATIRKSTGPSSLGDSRIESLLQYFGVLARQAGNFVGIKEEELLRQIQEGRLRDSFIHAGDIESALRYEDGMNDNARYLERLVVEGNPVLFPSNLRELIF